jgi:acyl-coenzyme A thioesterase PaaI-like protein
MVAEAKMVHSGKTTQVWDVEVRDESTGKMMALFRATQMILYPRI